VEQIQEKKTAMGMLPEGRGLDEVASYNVYRSQLVGFAPTLTKSLDVVFTGASQQSTNSLL